MFIIEPWASELFFVILRTVNILNIFQVIIIEGEIWQYAYVSFLLQKIFNNIINRDIPWPKVPEEMSKEAYDLIDQ